MKRFRFKAGNSNRLIRGPIARPMISFTRIACFTAALVFGFSAHAEEPVAPAKPLLWKVEGKELKKPSFLFGTLHIGSKEVVTFQPIAAQAFDAAQVVYTEIPLDQASQIALSASAVRTDGKKLADSIGEGLMRKLDTELRHISPKLDPTALQPLKTWMVASAIPLLRYQLTGARPFDAVIWNRAASAGKQTSALETGEAQFAIFDELGESEQVTLLSETLRLMKEYREKGEDPVENLAKAYLAGDDVALANEIQRQMSMADGPFKELGERLLKRILYDRNVTMAESMAEIFAREPDKSHFFAVGVGHYVGKQNIGELLQSKGYTVVRLPE